MIPIRIRPATEADSDQLVAMALEFLESVPAYAQLKPTAEAITAVVALILSLGDQGIILVAEAPGSPTGGMGDYPACLVGAIALIGVPHPLSGRSFADEVAWWVRPSLRGALVGPQLLVAGENWALGKGLSMIKMIAPIPSSVGRFYESRGYTAVETAYVKYFEQVTA
jgi:GNAT superfamily N-acetyltransferase